MNDHDEMAVEVRAILVKTGDTTLGVISHRMHVSCQVLFDMLHHNHEEFWTQRKAPLRETEVGLTSAGMARADTET